MGEVGLHFTCATVKLYILRIISNEIIIPKFSCSAIFGRTTELSVAKQMLHRGLHITLSAQSNAFAKLTKHGADTRPLGFRVADIADHYFVERESCGY